MVEPGGRPGVARRASDQPVYLSPFRPSEKPIEKREVQEVMTAGQFEIVVFDPKVTAVLFP